MLKWVNSSAVNWVYLRNISKYAAPDFNKQFIVMQSMTFNECIKSNIRIKTVDYWTQNIRVANKMDGIKLGKNSGDPVWLYFEQRRKRVKGLSRTDTKTKMKAARTLGKFNVMYLLK